MPAAIVIGAGLAGLTAADELLRRGWAVEVLEARDRVGGRTWSPRVATGAVAEMGAEFILPGNTELAALADDLGLALVEKGMRYGRREPRGVEVSRQDLDAAVASVDAALSDLEGNPSCREFLAGVDLDDAAREVILARAEISSARSADDVPAVDLAGIAHIGDEPSPSVAGGNQQLSLALAARLGDRIRLADPVESVAWTETRVRARTASGHAAEADRCVVAIPASVTGRIAFEPRLPASKREALAGVRYGHAAKLFVPLTDPAPPSAVTNVPERWWCWTQMGADGEPALLVSCFAGSPAALDRLAIERGPERWLDSLSALRPDLALDPGSAVLSTWDDDPWVGAAYSISSTPERAAALAESVGPIEFAGEHAAGNFSGLMEGAIRSGKRAAAGLAALLALTMAPADRADASTDPMLRAPDPLAGQRIAIDPGHNGENGSHPDEINRQVPIGNGETKECDTVGTQTASGLSESAYTMSVARKLKRLLKSSGARVRLTRKNDNGVGPCINRRAKIGNRFRADAAVSIHADGGPPSGRGFHVIYPTRIEGLTDDIYKQSKRLARGLRNAYEKRTGLPRSTYIGSNGLDARSDLGGLRLSDVPKVFIETGNMRNSADASKLERGKFRKRIARGIRDGLRRFLN